MRKKQLQFKILCFAYLLSGIKIYFNKGKHAPFPALFKEGQWVLPVFTGRT
jgi:hypothetical protein